MKDPCDQVIEAAIGGSIPSSFLGRHWSVNSLMGSWYFKWLPTIVVCYFRCSVQQKAGKRNHDFISSSSSLHASTSEGWHCVITCQKEFEIGALPWSIRLCRREPTTSGLGIGLTSVHYDSVFSIHLCCASLLLTCLHSHCQCTDKKLRSRWVKEVYNAKCLKIISVIGFLFA